MCGTRCVLIHSASITFTLMYIWLYHTCTHQYSKVQSVPPNGIICGHRPNVDRAKKFDAIYCGLCCCSFSIMVWSTYTQRRENKNPVTFDHQILLWQCVIFIKNIVSVKLLPWCCAYFHPSLYRNQHRCCTNLGKWTSFCNALVRHIRLHCTTLESLHVHCACSAISLNCFA